MKRMGVKESKQSQITALLNLCMGLEADVRFAPKDNYFTVAVPPPWNTYTQLAAMALQDKIKEWSKLYPDVVCYSFDSFSTLVYVL